MQRTENENVCGIRRICIYIFLNLTVCWINRASAVYRGKTYTALIKLPPCDTIAGYHSIYTHTRLTKRWGKTKTITALFDASLLIKIQVGAAYAVAMIILIYFSPTLC